MDKFQSVEKLPKLPPNDYLPPDTIKCCLPPPIRQPIPQQPYVSAPTFEQIVRTLEQDQALRVRVCQYLDIPH